MPSKTFFICTVCADIHFGGGAPVICPTCQTKDAYKPIAQKEAVQSMKLK